MMTLTQMVTDWSSLLTVNDEFSKGDDFYFECSDWSPFGDVEIYLYFK